jgi:hypothetical protein
VKKYSQNFHLHITTNGQSTIEVDFQEYHQRMLYDLSLRFPEFPDIDPNKKPYKQLRDTIK